MWAVKCTIVLLSSLVTAEMHLESQVKSTALHGTLLLKKFNEQMFVCNRKVGKIYRIVTFSWSCEDIIGCIVLKLLGNAVHYDISIVNCTLHTEKGTLIMPFSKYWTI